MTVVMLILLVFLLVCAIATSFAKNLLNTILIFMSYSLVMSIIWMVLESPDLAITEAAVGAGVTTVLFLITLKKIQSIIEEDRVDDEYEEEEGYIPSENSTENNIDKNTDINADTIADNNGEKTVEVSHEQTPGK
ncbi:MAG: DUF4040 domain-containing protein [Lachnospiraceae bacterium]|nr:DUF4040 domain-containing protein [Lachnospiraceae bacterium]